MCAVTEKFFLEEKVLFGLIGNHFGDGQRRGGARRGSVATMNDATPDFADSIIKNEIFNQTPVSIKGLRADSCWAPTINKNGERKKKFNKNKNKKNKRRENK